MTEGRNAMEKNVSRGDEKNNRINESVRLMRGMVGKFLYKIRIHRSESRGLAAVGNTLGKADGLLESILRKYPFG